MDRVKLQVHNKISGETYLKDEVYDRGYIEEWIQHQKDNTGCVSFEWTIVDIK